jgi:hypothetical protein
MDDGNVIKAGFKLNGGLKSTRQAGSIQGKIWFLASDYQNGNCMDTGIYLVGCVCWFHWQMLLAI